MTDSAVPAAMRRHVSTLNDGVAEMPFRTDPTPTVNELSPPKMAASESGRMSAKRRSFGLIAYAVLKLATGRGREAHWLAYLFAALFLVRYIWLVR